MFPLATAIQIAAIPPDARCGPMPHSDTRCNSLGAGDVLYWEDDPCDRVFQVVSGILRLCKLTADGRRQVTGFAYAGQFVGMSRDDVYVHTAEAVVVCKIRAFTPAQLMREAESDPGLTRHFLSQTVGDLLAAQERMLLLGRKTAMERLASFLIELSRRTGEPGQPTDDIYVPMTRADIADYLGLTVETVSRMFTKLRASGIIQLRSAAHVRVLDGLRLAEIAADENHGAVH